MPLNFEMGYGQCIQGGGLTTSQVISTRAQVNTLDMYEYTLHTPATSEWNEHQQAFSSTVEIIKLPKLPPSIWGQIALINGI